MSATAATSTAVDTNASAERPMPEPAIEPPFNSLAPPYTTIVADPPWRYDSDTEQDGITRSAVITRSVKRDGTLARGVRDHTYSRMSADEITALPVRQLAARNAHLYLWVTNAFISEAHTIARAWGFKPKTVLTWVKVHQDDPCRVSMKTGYYFRGATEHAIFAVRGSLPLQTTDGQPTAYLWPRIGAHSIKPAAFGDLVERCSPGPYVELFARQPRLGWDSWGYGYETAVADVG
jgi:N6-adenosine-specific RNA methylase IME4